MATLWLIGMMGTGKTTIAPLVAERIGTEWFDTDLEIEARTGRAVPDLVASDEQAFREVEHEVVTTLAGRPVVVACGGGVVTEPRMVTTMRETGIVVLLEAPLVTLAGRVGDGTGRPLLTGGAAGALERISAGREEEYRAAAHATVDADGPPDEVADRVVGAWTRSS